MAETTKQARQETYPEGSYELEVLGQTFAESKAGNPYLAVKIKVNKLEKTKNGSPVPAGLIMDGHRFINLHFTEGTIERTKAFLKDAGYRGSDLRTLDAKHPQPASLAGYKFKGSCKHETYEGKTRDKFEAYSNNGGGNNKWMENLKSVSQTRLLGLNALWNSQNAGIPAATHISKAADGPAPFAPEGAKNADDFTMDWD